MGAYERNTIQGKLVYAVADGKERFIPVKGKKAEKIFPGEWILKDETDMVVTKVTTKQSEAAAITPKTRGCVICLQGNSLIGLEELLPVADELIAKILEYCGGEARIVFSG
jgi:DNA/RNA-binding domain of Phe-tRNA-synthetase-like protein